VSPRDTLLAAMVDCLSAITIANGYHTDAGAHVARELGQVADDAVASLTVAIARQARATDAALVRTHRLTELAVAIKVPADQDAAQARLDEAVADVERAMDPATGRAKFAVGIAFPQYVEMRPISPEAGMKWIGALVLYQTHIPIR
jgi:hypothetical protein